MRFKLSLPTTFLGLVLALTMIRLSYWQWERHIQKQDLIATLDARLEKAPIELSEILTESNWNELIHRRVKITGTYDFAHEVVLKNRRLEGRAGVFVLTPLRLKETDKYILINRGFLPLELANQKDRVPFQRHGLHGETQAQFVGVLKESVPRKMWSPKDKEAGSGLPWVDQWLRVDLQSIARQLPYPILPIWAEIMDEPDIKVARNKIIQLSSQRDEILTLAGRDAVVSSQFKTETLPIPTYDIIIPAGRHLGYVFEWAIMSVLTIIITVVLQLRRETTINIKTLSN